MAAYLCDFRGPPAPPGPLLVKPDYSAPGGESIFHRQKVRAKNVVFLRSGVREGGAGGGVFRGGAGSRLLVLDGCVLTCQCIHSS